MSFLPEHIKALIAPLVSLVETESPRLKTENGSAAYHNGKEFRAFYELNLPNNGTRAFKFVVTGNSTLLSSQIEVLTGGISYKVYYSGIESGTFTDLTTYTVNNTVTNESSNVTVSTGGDLDVAGIDAADVTYIAAGHKVSVADSSSSMPRSFPPTTAYVIVETLDSVNTATVGTLKWQWQNG